MIFYYEWKKLFLKKTLLCVLLIFTVIDIAKAWQEYRTSTYLTDDKAPDMMSWSEAYWTLYPEYRGEITTDKMNDFLEYYRPLEEKISDLTASSIADNPDYMTGSAWQDYYLLERYYAKPMKYFYQYGNKAGRVAEKAKENASFYQKHGNIYESRKNAMIYHLYHDRTVKEFAYTEMYHYYLYYDFSDVLIFLLCIYGIARVFSCEKEAQMEELNVVSVNGGKRLVRYKILAVLLYTACISCWFALVDFFSFAVFFRSLEGENMPIYAIENFSGSAVTCTIGQYAIISFFARTLGFFVFSMIFLTISELCKNALTPFVISVALCIIVIFTGDYFAHSSHIIWKVINPYFLITNRTLFCETEFVNFFGNPVFSYEAALVWGAAACLFFACIVWLLSKRNVLWSKKGRRKYHADIEV